MGATQTGYRYAPTPPERTPVAFGLVTPRIYTKKGDDGTTGLLFGGRVRKDSWRIELNGAIDEAQAAIGVARAETPPGSEVNDRLIWLARDLYVVMAEVATAPENRTKLVAGSTLVSADMVSALEARIDDLLARFEMPSDFTVPGGTGSPPRWTWRARSSAGPSASPWPSRSRVPT